MAPACLKARCPMDHDELRYSRQRDIVPPDRLAGCKATVVGVGAIGRQVAQQLAAMGVPWLQLVDPEVVEPSNLASQGYLEADLGRFKAQATGELCRRINAKLEIYAVTERFRRSMDVGDALFCAVDRIEVRQLIWNSVNDRVACFVDGRMNGEAIRIVSAADPASLLHYPATLFTAQEVHPGSCTAKTTIYCANVAAGLMLTQFTRWLRGLPVEPDLSVNLLSSELTVMPAG